MKSLLATDSLAAAFLGMVGLQFAIALPTNTDLSTDSTDQVSQLSQVIGGITWTGRIFADDEHDSTLKGDIQQIRDQILAINPNYSKENDIDEHLEHHPIDTNMTVHPRAGDGKIVCGDPKGNTQVTWEACWDGIQSLTTHSYGFSRCSVDAHSTARVSCSYNCGIYLKNPTDKKWEGLCRDVATDVIYIAPKCPG